MHENPDPPASTTPLGVVRPLVADDLENADRIFRRAFGTFLHLPNPEDFCGDADYITSRWGSPAVAAFGLEVDGVLVGSNFATRWGSFAFVGPLSIDPQFQGQGLAAQLMEPVMEAFERWHCTHEALFTFAQSPKHIHLYQKFGFQPRFLTLVGTFDPAQLAGTGFEAQLLSEAEDERATRVEAIYALTNQLMPDLDLSDEITATIDEALGDVLLLDSAEGLRGFAICHEGADTEAGSDNCFVKFAAVAPGPMASIDFEELLSCIGAFARDCHCATVTAGVNTAAESALAIMKKRGFRSSFSGIEMRRPSEGCWSGPSFFVIGDLR